MKDSVSDEARHFVFMLNPIMQRPVVAAFCTVAVICMIRFLKLWYDSRAAVRGLVCSSLESLDCLQLSDLVISSFLGSPNHRATASSGATSKQWAKSR